MNHLLLILLTILLVAGAVILHYEALDRLSRLLPTLSVRHRVRIIFGVAAILFTHTLQVALFAVGYWLCSFVGPGALTGEFSGKATDFMYFSFVTFTTVGYGDITPVGDFRLLAGIESLTGFVLITWTASYFYLLMSQQWED